MVGPLSDTWIAAFFIGVQDGETRIKREGGDNKWKIGYHFLAFWD
jgi:hypothetical protein